MNAVADINESEILDSIIRDLYARRDSQDLDFDERLKIDDRLMKAIAMRKKERGRKGRGFDLGQ